MSKAICFLVSLITMMAIAQATFLPTITISKGFPVAHHGLGHGWGHGHGLLLGHSLSLDIGLGHPSNLLPRLGVAILPKPGLVIHNVVPVRKIIHVPVPYPVYYKPSYKPAYSDGY